MEFQLFEHVFDFDEKVMARAAAANYLEKMNALARQVTRVVFLSTIRSKEDLIEDQGSIAESVIEYFFDPAIKLLTSAGIYTVSEEKFKECYEYDFDFDELVAEYLAKCGTLENLFKRSFVDEAGYMALCKKGMERVKGLTLEFLKMGGYISEEPSYDDECASIFDNMQNDRIPPKKVPSLLVNLIEADPFNEEYYDYVAENFPSERANAKKMKSQLCPLDYEFFSDVPEEEIDKFKKKVGELSEEWFSIDYAEFLEEYENHDADEDADENAGDDGGSENKESVKTNSGNVAVSAQDLKEFQKNLSCGCIIWFVIIIVVVIALIKFIH